MKSVCLRIYTSEFQKHKGMLLFEWLLEFARQKNLQGGSAFRAIAGYGRHGFVQEHFFELASNVPIEIVFIDEKKKIEQFINELTKEKINSFYITSEVDYGIL